jgi:hypothetical protein
MYLKYCLCIRAAQHLPQRQIAPGASGAIVKESDMLRLLMAPANAICDVMRVDDEGERAVIRMLVNMLLLSFVSVMVFVVAIEAA